MIVENVDSLKIHKLSQEQYDAALSAGTLDDNALYLTPNSSGSLADEVTIGLNEDGSFYVKDGGIDVNKIEDVQELRKEMGLGDTLGALPVENMAITIVDDAETYADYGAAEGYVLSPKALKSSSSVMSATINYSSSSATSIATSLVNKALTVVGSSSNGVSVNSGTFTINESGYYEIFYNLACSFTCVAKNISYVGNTSTMTVTANASTLGDLTLLSETLSATATGATYSGETGSIFIYIPQNEELTFSMSAQGTTHASNVATTLSVDSLIVTVTRTTPAEATTTE